TGDRSAEAATDSVAGYCIARNFANGVANRCVAALRRGKEADPEGTTANGAALLRKCRKRAPSPKPTDGRHGYETASTTRRALRGPCGAGRKGWRDRPASTSGNESRGALRASWRWVDRGASC